VAVAGDGECRRALISQAEALGLSDRVTLVGHVDDVRSFHQALDVYVQTSDSEGVPNAVLEAMAVGTPVVATDVGGTSELIGHNVHGLLVPRGDVRAIANGIVATIADRTATNARVAAARARVEGELSFERRVRLVEQVYDDLMTARRSRR
jgi:glycosyltransferase involved in cell wall biosynthesis